MSQKLSVLIRAAPVPREWRSERGWALAWATHLHFASDKPELGGFTVHLRPPEKQAQGPDRNLTWNRRLSAGPGASHNPGKDRGMGWKQLHRQLPASWELWPTAQPSLLCFWISLLSLTLGATFSREQHTRLAVFSVHHWIT